MALTTYVELQAAIASWLARDDLTAYIPDFIRLFEASAQRRLKVRSQESSATFTPSGGVVTLPSDFLGYRRVNWTGTPSRDLDYVSPSLIAPYRNNIGSVPTVFTIQGAYLYIGSPDDTTDIAIDYFQRTPALSAGLNWLFTTHPDAYLFGSLCEACAFNKDVDPAGLWKARRDEVFDEITKLDFNERQGMQVRVMGATP